LNGPAAGQWRRVVQTIDSTAYLVDTAIPSGTEVVSISTAFVNENYQHNRIDLRGGRRSSPLVLAGNHFGTSVIKNHFIGGEYAFKLTAFPTETPVMWGWSHTPYLGGVIEGNVLEDAEKGGIVGVEHDGRYIKTNQGRVYMTVKLGDNTVRWSEAFLSHAAAAGSNQPLAGLTLGYSPSHDAGELVASAHGNRIDTPGGKEPAPPLMIHAADYNGQRLQNRKLSLSSGGANLKITPREASKRPTSRSH
jgi:hypothetical protein